MLQNGFVAIRCCGSRLLNRFSFPTQEYFPTAVINRPRHRHSLGIRLLAAPLKIP